MLRHSIAPLVVFSDCAFVLTCIARGRQWATAARRPWAAIWVLIWNILEEPDYNVRKTAAHLSLQRARELGVEYEVRGNEHAD